MGIHSATRDRNADRAAPADARGDWTRALDGNDLKAALALAEKEKQKRARRTSSRRTAGEQAGEAQAAQQFARNPTFPPPGGASGIP
jgi:hypothetical protein